MQVRFLPGLRTDRKTSTTCLAATKSGASKACFRLRMTKLMILPKGDVLKVHCESKSGTSSKAKRSEVVLPLYNALLSKADELISIVGPQVISWAVSALKHKTASSSEHCFFIFHKLLVIWWNGRTYGLLQRNARLFKTDLDIFLHVFYVNHRIIHTTF